MAAVSNVLFSTMALFLSLTVSLTLPTSSTAGGADILAKFNEKMQGDSQYVDFYKAYFKSTAPLTLFTELNAGKKVTIFIPNKAAFSKIPSSVTKNNTKLGNLIVNHCVKNKRVDYTLWKNTKDGASWPANYKNRKIVKETKGVSLNNAVSKTKVVEKTVKWDFFASSNLVAHGVDYYTVTTSL